MCRVLVVEDEPDLRELADSLLSSFGYTAVLAVNGADGLEKLRTQHPCVVLLDLMMPVMDGFEFRRRQLRDPLLASIPVVCLTAMHDASAIQARLGVPCLRKPVDFEKLYDVIRRHCGTPTPGPHV
jgi:CheY-like chemotaxis protein